MRCLWPCGPATWFTARIVVVPQNGSLFIRSNVNETLSLSLLHPVLIAIATLCFRSLRFHPIIEKKFEIKEIGKIDFNTHRKFFLQTDSLVEFET